VLSGKAGRVSEVEELAGAGLDGATGTALR
jgi:hypothetical protein